uniref:Transposase InsD for insertion element IS2 n=1 Tax=Klebsiella pneumoniae TaxID=573 RepID=A0A8B0SYN0_KLEPN|nr:Transposase InsD for insertion element IS2 [Klebsiella pneumoniae]
MPDTAVQWLTDNGSAYTAYETWRFARELNLEPCTTAVSSPQSNGMAERFVKTMKEDYIAFMPKTGCENSTAKPCSSVHALQ